jgi:superfamily II DNA or RNA helicase
VIPYIHTSGKNVISCNADLIILDNGNYPLLISLCDISVKTKKICADLISDKYGDVYLKDRKDITFNQRLFSWNQSFRYRSDKIDRMLTHTVIYNTKINQYCIDWNNDGRIQILTKYLRNIHYLPVTEDVVENVLIADEEYCKQFTYSDYRCVKELQVYTSNPMFENLKAYHINVSSFKSRLNSIKLEGFDDNFKWDEIEDIEDYLFTFLEPIKEKLKENIKTLYNPNKICQEMFKGKLKPYDSQVPIIQAGIEVLNRDRFVYLAAEMGTGKTPMSSKINHCHMKEKGKQAYVTLVMCPAITLSQWKDEIKNSIGDKVDVHIIKKTNDFIKIYNETNLKFDKPTYFLVGKETFKLDAKKRHGVNIKKKNIKRKKKIEHGGYYKWTSADHVKETITVACCPDCGRPIQNLLRKTEDVFFNESDFQGNPKKSNYKCTICGAVLWQSTYDKTKKSSLLRFIKTKNIRFDSLICDEIHESANGESLIGSSTRTLFNYANKIILLSGTSNNGYSSSLHNVFMGLLSQTLIKNEVIDMKRFIETYGTLQAVSKRKDGEYHRSGRAEIKDSEFKEIEGVNPILFTRFMSQNFIFATLDDLGKDLPELNEYYVPIKHIDEMDMNEHRLINDIKYANAFNAKMYESTIVKHYVNNPYNWGSIEIEGKDTVEVVQPKNLSDESELLPKEIELLRIIKQEVSEGRKCCVYVDFNNGGQYMQGDPLPHRIEKILKDNGIRVFQLKPSVPTYERRELIEKKKDSFDVLITNPMLVQVGLNLVFIPTYINYMPSYQYSVTSQSNRRGYRANSTFENRIYHLYYQGSVEDGIIKRYQRKMAEAQAIEAKFNVKLEDESIRTSSILGKKINDNIVV